jgi:hypothetical protein
LPFFINFKRLLIWQLNHFALRKHIFLKAFLVAFGE